MWISFIYPELHFKRSCVLAGTSLPPPPPPRISMPHLITSGHLEFQARRFLLLFIAESFVCASQNVEQKVAQTSSSKWRLWLKQQVVLPYSSTKKCANMALGGGVMEMWVLSYIAVDRQIPVLVFAWMPALFLWCAKGDCLAKQDDVSGLRHRSTLIVCYLLFTLNLAKKKKRKFWSWNSPPWIVSGLFGMWPNQSTAF